MSRSSLIKIGVVVLLPAGQNILVGPKRKSKNKTIDQTLIENMQLIASDGNLGQYIG